MEHERGVAPPDEEMKHIGGSEYGTKFIRLETVGEIKNNRSLRSRKVSLIWSVERVALQLQLVCMSIANVITALKLVNGAEAVKCNFLRPNKDDDFERPWTFTTGITSFSIDFVVDETQVVPLTKKQLNEILKNEFPEKVTKVE